MKEHGTEAGAHLAAISAAEEAGEVLRGTFGKEQAVRHKGEVDIVTEADERAEAVIREVLLGAFPPLSRVNTVPRCASSRNVPPSGTS